jgi:hypothetical protein
VPEEPVPPALDWSAVEASLLRLESVEGARVIPDPSGGIAEVHILARGERHPKQISRDVQSLLITRWGIRIDHRKVSVARFEDEAVAASEPPRLALQALRINLNAELATVEVELAARETLLVGKAQGPVTPEHLLRLVAEAILEALKPELGRQRVRAILRTVTTHTVARRDAVLVLINLVGPYGELLVVGSAYVRRNQLWSVGQAVLDAVNRRLTMDTLAI